MFLHKPILLVMIKNGFSREEEDKFIEEKSLL